MIKTSVVIPAYNEEAAIEEVIQGIREAMDKTQDAYEIIIVDDNSKDRTAEIVSKMENVRLVRHKSNKGVGAARKTGILHAKGEYILMTDGDGTYPTENIPELISHLPEYDMAVGARIEEKGTMKILRSFAKGILLKLVCIISETNIPDLNSGLRVFKKKAALKFFGILPDGHSWVSTITLAFFSNGYSVKYVPIKYFTRKGKSTFHPIKDTYNYFLTINRVIMYFRPLKFFVPLTFCILLGGSIRFLYHALVLHNVRESDIMIILTGIMVGTVGVLADLVLKLQRINFIKMEFKDEE